MNFSYILKIYNIFTKDRFALVYHGIFSNSILYKTTDLITKTFESDSKGLQNRISYLMIEAFQNVVRYSESPKLDAKFSNDIYILRSIGDNFFIITANPVNKKKTEELKYYLEDLNRLDPEELRELYLKVLTNQRFTEKGGAGLGFIEMMRKSKNKLKFKFLPYNSEYQWFYFQIQLNLRKKSSDFDLDLTEAQTLHKLAEETNSIIIQKTDVVAEALVPLIRIVKDNLRTTHLPMQKKIFNILVELLQDVSAYTKELKFKKEVIFILGLDKNGKYYVLVGSMVDSKILDTKLRLIDKYFGMDSKQLQEIYLKKLIKLDTNESELRTIKILSLGTNYQYYTSKHNNMHFLVQKIEL